MLPFLVAPRVFAAALTGLLICALTTAAAPAPWTLSDTYRGRDFIRRFDYWGDVNASLPDPTHGRVKYLGRDDAEQQNLTYVDADGQFILAVDTTPYVLGGRPSVRITSSQTYEDGIFVLNITHFPVGCSVWPAFWMVAPDTSAYPLGGEIDILENANDETASNLVSVHTADLCKISNDSSILGQTGVNLLTNCTVDYVTGNQGCRNEMNGGSAATSSRGLNKEGGGIFATERSLGSAGRGINVWFWPHDQVPDDLMPGSTAVDPTKWGLPGAAFPFADDCHDEFGPLSFVFDITREQQKGIARHVAAADTLLLLPQSAGTGLATRTCGADAVPSTHPARHRSTTTAEAIRKLTLSCPTCGSLQAVAVMPTPPSRRTDTTPTCPLTCPLLLSDKELSMTVLEFNAIVA